MPRVHLSDLDVLVQQALRSAGASEHAARIVAETIVSAERDGAPGHGVQRLPGYLSSLRSGWIDGQAEPIVDASSGAVVKVDAGNGFAQVALATACGLLTAKAREHGTATLFTRNSHHFGALWPDLEPLARDGFVALSAINSRARMTLWNGSAPVVGTNAIAFACPRGGGMPPIIWDQASSVMSQGDVLVARAAGRSIPVGVGLDASGKGTTSPADLLQGGAFLPFGGPKGASIAFMVEILVAACSDATFGYQDKSSQVPGAMTSHAGQFLMLIDPRHASIAGETGGFEQRVEAFLVAILASGVSRLPGEKRYMHRAISTQVGVDIPDEAYALLQSATS